MHKINYLQLGGAFDMKALDKDMNKMFKQGKKELKQASNIASTGNKMGMSGGLQAGLGAASSML